MDGRLLTDLRNESIKTDKRSHTWSTCWIRTAFMHFNIQKFDWI